MTMPAVQMHSYGGPEVLTLGEVPKPVAGTGEVLVRVHAAAVTFWDITHRRGDLREMDGYYDYIPGLPMTPGYEAAGVVEAVGPEVTEYQVGDRVAWTWLDSGAYATYANVPVSYVFPVPDGVDLDQAAGGLVQGSLAYGLTHFAYPVREGDWCLVQSAAGGAGSLVTQFARLRGGRVIGVASTEEKAVVARAAGAEEVIVSTNSDVVEEVMRITEGKGVNVVYDAVGKDTFEMNLDSLTPLGHFVNYGQSSGFLPPIDAMSLPAKKCPFITRFSLESIVDRDDFAKWQEVYREYFFDFVREGKISVHIDRCYDLADAAKAHAAVEQRETSGRVLLRPNS
jgi:NADPH2:quinone reductase